MATHNVGTAFDYVMQSSAAATGTGAGPMSTGGLAGVLLQVTGTFSATVTMQANLDSNFLAVPVYNVLTGAWVAAGTITATGIYAVPAPGDQLQANVTAYVSGNVTVTAKGMAVWPFPAPVLQSTGVIGQVAQGTPAALASAWPHYLAGATDNGLSKGKQVNLNATVRAVKASAGVLYGLTIENSQAAKAFIQVFDVASGGVTLATTVPDWEFEVAANSTYTLPVPAAGIPFGTTISIASTTGEFGNTGTNNGLNAYWLYK